MGNFPGVTLLLLTCTAERKPQEAGKAARSRGSPATEGSLGTGLGLGGGKGQLEQRGTLRAEAKATGAQERGASGLRGRTQGSEELPDSEWRVLGTQRSGREALDSGRGLGLRGGASWFGGGAMGHREGS